MMTLLHLDIHRVPLLLLLLTLIPFSLLLATVSVSLLLANHLGKLQALIFNSLALFSCFLQSLNSAFK